MKKLVSAIFVLFVLNLFVFTAPAKASMMVRQTPLLVATESTTAEDELSGKLVWDKLQAKKVTCANLTDDDFDVLGDYFMGQRLGSTAVHETMNSRMTAMMGELGEKQMHISLGKRLSGCDTGFAIPTNGSSFLPELGLTTMMGRTSMPGFYNVYPLISLIFCLLISTFLVLGIIYFWKGINRKK